MDVSTDPYELKLYEMFQSCETQKKSGLLDEIALARLCALLELRDCGALLISNLARNGSLKLGVSFEQFKEALLQFLQEDGCATNISAAPLSISGDGVICKERSLVITDQVDPMAFIDSPPTESSDREVSPKLVVGTKKYGRRSRPQLNTLNLDGFSLTESDNTDEDQQQQEPQQQQQQSLINNEMQINLQVQRSVSQSDIPGTRRLRPKQLSGSKLKRCSSLPARKNLQQQIQKTAVSKTSNTSKTSQKQNQQQNISSSVESLDTLATTPAQLETISAQSIIEIWDGLDGRGILQALGFDDDEVNVLQLIKVLEEEVHPLDANDPHATMLQALVTLQSAELSSLRQAYRQLHAENVKLRTDNKEANRRVSMLAVEIDERHASLEENSKRQILELEQRHSNVVRDLTDNWNNLTSRLDLQIKSFEQEEIRLKTELELIRTENSELETEHQKSQKQITELLEQNIQLNNELANGVAACKPLSEQNVIVSISKSTEEDEFIQLIEKVGNLQIENSQLRDKNDELVVEVENLQLELIRSKSKIKKTNQTELELESTIADADLVDQSLSGASATKRRGDSPSKTRITEESPRLGKLRKCADESGNSEHSDTSDEWVALNSELQRSSTTDVKEEQHVKELKQRISDLEQQLTHRTENSSCSSNKMQGNPSDTERCKELEASLEQMQRAYEDCEDYWQSKLSDERQLFDKERQLYEDEQLESDKKFTELMEKVREYEEQFSKDGRLSPIEERDNLEQQYADLEAEIAALRDNSMLMLEDKSKQIDSLQTEIEDLRIKLGESVEILTGACELSTDSVAQLNAEVALSPASSPISYLWHQSTIQEPAKNFVSSEDANCVVSSMVVLQDSSSKMANRNYLSTSETTIFSTTPAIDSNTNVVPAVAPIQKPSRAKSPQQQSQSEGEIADYETSSTASNKSFDAHSVTSTFATKTSFLSQEKTMGPSSIKEELKRLKFFELSLKEQIKDLSLQRDGLVMELQQLHEARPVLEKAYARTAHPNLIQRVNQLELKNRHLLNVIKQYQQHSNSMIEQNWREYQEKLNVLHGRLETQSAMLAEQTQRLQNADILVKDLYVENSHLTATVQRFEQQRARVNLIHQQQQQQQMQQPQRIIGPSLGLGLSNGLPGMP